MKSVNKVKSRITVLLDRLEGEVKVPGLRDFYELKELLTLEHNPSMPRGRRRRTYTELMADFEYTKTELERLHFDVLPTLQEKAAIDRCKRRITSLRKKYRRLCKIIEVYPDYLPPRSV